MRGHAYHEIREALRDDPDEVAFVPLNKLPPNQRNAFESVGTGVDLGVWREVGSRMTVQIFDDEAMVGGWVTVEPGRYRCAVNRSGAVTIKTVI